MTVLFALVLALQAQEPLDEATLEGDTIRQDERLGRQGQEPKEPREPLTPLEPFANPSNWETEWFPGSVLFPYYIADPLTPRSGSKVMMPIKTEDNYKIENCLGSSRTIFRKVDYGNNEGIDFGVDGAVISRFDISEAWDMDAADYIFGFPFGYRNGRFSSRLRVWHLTSHLGDELITREGAKPIRYHKNELQLSFAYDWTAEFRTYVDAGYGFYIGTPNKRWKGQVGAEWVGELSPKLPRVFAAVDVKWRQETEWDTAVALQSGFFLVQGADRYTMGLRLYLELYYGKAAQTQFPEERDFYWAWGFAASF